MIAFEPLVFLLFLAVGNIISRKMSRTSSCVFDCGFSPAGEEALIEIGHLILPLAMNDKKY